LSAPRLDINAASESDDEVGLNSFQQQVCNH
jgi:hypothetical protein